MANASIILLITNLIHILFIGDYTQPVGLEQTLLLQGGGVPFGIELIGENELIHNDIYLHIFAKTKHISILITARNS